MLHDSDLSGWNQAFKLIINSDFAISKNICVFEIIKIRVK